MDIFTTSAITGASCLGVGFGLGWYIRGRGVTGVKVDLENVKKEIEDLKNKISPPAQPAANPVSPVVS